MQQTTSADDTFRCIFRSRGRGNFVSEVHARHLETVFLRQIYLHSFILGQFFINMHMKAGQYRPASKTPFEWRFASRPIMAQECMLPGS